MGFAVGFGIVKAWNRIENPRVDGSIPSQATTVARKARKPKGFRAFSIAPRTVRKNGAMLKSLVLQRLG